MKQLQVLAALLLFWHVPTLQAAGAREQLLKGIYEQEVNNDRDASVAAYEAALREFEPERVLAASALARLAEVQQQRGKTNEAHLARMRLLREFSDQTNFVAAALKDEPALRDWKTVQVVAPPNSDANVQTLDPAAEEELEIKRIQGLIKDSPDLINNRSPLAPLSSAAGAGQIRVVNLLIDNGADPNLLLGDGSTPFSHAIMAGRRSVVEVMVKRGADVNKVFTRFRPTTPLQLAAEFGYSSIAQLLLDKGASVNAGAGVGVTAINQAVQQKNLLVAQLLLAAGADVNARAVDGTSALSAAVRLGWVEGLELLLKSKPELDATYKDPSGTSSLLGLGAQKGKLESVKLLLQAGANSSGPTNVIPPLALAMDFPPIAALLVKSGADINAKFEEVPLLHAFVKLMKTNSVSLLLDLHADPNLLDQFGYAPLHYASWIHDTRQRRQTISRDVVELLLRKGANPNLRATNGMTALKGAAGWIPGYSINNGRKAGSPILVSLLDHKADPDLQYLNGDTLLHWASASRNPELANLLLAHKANPNIANNEGLTAMDYAAQVMHQATYLNRPEGLKFTHFLVPQGSMRLLQELPPTDSEARRASPLGEAYETVDILERNGARTSQATLWAYGKGDQLFLRWPHESTMQLGKAMVLLGSPTGSVNLRRRGQTKILRMSPEEVEAKKNDFPMSNWDELEIINP